MERKKLSDELNNYQYVFLTILAVLILFGTNHWIFSCLALLISAMIVFWGDETYAVILLIFVMPLAEIFKPYPNTTSFYTYLVLLFVVRTFIKKWNVPLSIYTFSIYIFFIQFVTGNIDLLKSIKLIAGLLVVYYVIDSQIWKHKRTVFISYVTGIIVSSLFRFLDSEIFQISAYVSLKELGKGIGYDTLTRFSGLFWDPNYYSINLIISLCLVVILYYKKEVRKLSALILAGILVYFTIITYSKSSILMLLIPLLLLIYVNHKTERHMEQWFCVVGLIAVSTYALITGVEFLEVIIARFSLAGDDINRLTTGRWETWGNYLAYFWDKPLVSLFGLGIGADLLNGVAAHNVYLEIPYHLGIIGMGLLFFVIYQISGVIDVKVKKNFINYSVVTSIMLMYFFLCELFDYQAPIHLILGILVLKTNMQTMVEKL